jgi:hypothetical protein
MEQQKETARRLLPQPDGWIGKQMAPQGEGKAE